MLLLGFHLVLAISPPPLTRRQLLLHHCGASCLAVAAGGGIPSEAAAIELASERGSRSPSYGEFAKMDLTLGGDEADAVARNQLGSATGDKAYAAAFADMDASERAALKIKVDAVVTRWRNMQGAATKALSASTVAYPVAQSALDNNMNQIKTDMRTVSKALSGGDITVRDVTKGGVDQPQFDYNTGQFNLKPLVAQAEDVFKVINDAYFAGIKAKAAPKALKGLADADAKFNAWLGAVQEAEVGQS